MIWEPAGPDNLRCKPHDRTFGKASTCPDCDAQPAAVEVDVQGEAPVAPPTGCKSAEGLERDVVAVMEFASERMRTASKGKSRPSQSIAIKWAEVVLKAARAAGEYARSREDNERVKRLEARAKALKNRGAAN